MTGQIDTTVEVDNLKELITDVLNMSKQQGATSAQVSASIGAGLSATARMGDVENISFHRDKAFGVTVYFGQKKGYASTSDTSIESIHSTVKAACNIAKYTAEDECAGLADASLMATEFRDLQMYYPWDLTAEQAIEMAISTDDYARSLDAKITNSDGASISTGESVRVYGNSHGFLQGSYSSRHSMSCVLIAQEGNNMQRDYDYSVARNAENLIDPKKMAESAVQKTIARLGARKIKTTKAPVLLTPQLSAGLISSFLSAIKGSSLYRRSSFLLDALDTQVFPSTIRIHEDPFLKGGFASCNYDAEGVKPTPRDIIHDGVLQGYILGSYSARRLGLQTTGNAGGVHNIEISTGKLSQPELMQKMGTGLLVTELMGQGVNLVTGDYSRGASGFWVENGEIQYPVHEITIAGNLKDMLLNIVEIGADIDPRSHILTGSILLDTMMIAGA